jgi:very-short-patch-repair endonuclease
MSLPEVLLWNKLRRKSAGIKFRKQHPIETYVADFCCATAKLAIEVDGFAHDAGDRPERDATRDAVLRARGIDTVRIAASEVLASPGDVAEAIAAVCRERSPSPLLRNGEDLQAFATTLSGSSSPNTRW